MAVNTPGVAYEYHRPVLRRKQPCRYSDIILEVAKMI